MHQEQATAEERRATPKLDYRSPVLRLYGRVVDITKSGGSSMRSDAGNNMMWT